LKSRLIGYWVVTALLAFDIGSGGVGQFTHLPDNVEGMTRLDY
jgi:hypothetical protein